MQVKIELCCHISSSTLDFSGYVKVRCVDDPTLFSRSQTSDEHQSTISEGSEEESNEEEDEKEEDDEVGTMKSFRNPLSNIAQKSSYEDQVVKPSLKLPTPPSMMKRRNSFDPIGEEEEEDEDAPEIGFMDRFGERIGKDNYLRPKFGPSEREIAKINNPLPNIVQNAPNKERRPSGVMPLGFLNQQQLLQEKYNKTLMASNKKPKTPEPIEEKLPSPLPTKTEPSFRMNEDDDYAYVTLKPIPLEQLGERSNSRGSIINDSCFQYKEVAIVEDDEDDPYPINAEMEKRCYLSSKRLMFFFANQFYEIARRIGKGNLTSSATILAPSILCREEVDDSYKELTWKFIPTIEVSFWPDEYFEYFMRKRPVMRHKRTNVSYQWPEQSQIQAIRQIGCNILPLGFNHPKKSTPNPDADIEWAIHFTKAEIFLARGLHHPKIRVYLFILLMYKAYFEAFDGIKEMHLRNILYWLIEKSPGDWTEENIGEKFTLVLKMLKRNLEKQKMPHYFMAKSNMFANIPNHKLRQAQEKVHRIRENPVMYVLHSILKLQYEKSFYPKLDIMKLYKILTTENQLTMMNPALMGSVTDDTPLWERPKAEKKKTGKNAESDDKYQIRMRRLRENIEEEAKKAKTGADKKHAIIDLKASIKVFDEARKSLVLEFFIGHFLRMAEKSNEFRNRGQSYMYLSQSENLVTLLEELGFDDKPNVREFKQEILRLRENVNYKLYLKDYWNISYGHPQLSSGSFRFGSGLPVPPTEKKPQTKGPRIPRKLPDEKKLKLEVIADVHDTESESSSGRRGRKITLDNFDVSESMDFDWDEYTHL